MESERIVCPKKKMEDLLIWLRNSVDVTEIDSSYFSKSFRDHLKHNAVHAVSNYRLQVSEDAMKFAYFKLEQTAKNEEYNRILNNTNEPFVYVVFEEKTGYILSNNEQLFFSLIIEQGVNQEDIDSNSFYFMFYRDCLNTYYQR